MSKIEAQAKISHSSIERKNRKKENKFQYIKE